MVAWKCHLEAAWPTPHSQTGILGQWQTQLHKVIELMTGGSAMGTLHGALHLPSEQIADGTVAEALGIVPGLISLCTHRALPFQLPEKGLALRPVQLSLHISTAAPWQLQRVTKQSPTAIGLRQEAIQECHHSGTGDAFFLPSISLQ